MTSSAFDEAESFVGRGAELGTLARHEQRARAAPSVIVLSGRPGSGKTALVRRFVATLQNRNVVRVAARTNTSSNPPFELAADIVATLDGVGPAPNGYTRSTTVQCAKDLLAALARACDPRPAVVVLDNLDCADPESLEAIGFAARRLESEPLLLVLVGHDKPKTWRTILAAQDWPSPPDSIRLQPLSRDESVRLCEVLHLPDPILSASWLYARSEGNPLHLRSLISGRTGRAADGHLGDSLIDTLREEIERLALVQRDLLLAIAVSGSPISVPDLAALASVDPEAMVGELIDRGILEWQDGSIERLGFRSTLYQGEIYALADRVRRRQLHARAAGITSGSERFRHLVGAALGYDDELAGELDDASEAELGADDARAAQYLLWSAHLTRSPTRRGRRYAEAVRLLIVASRDAEAIHHESTVRELDPSPRRSETLALISLARSELEQARTLITRALAEALDERADDVIPRIETERAYIGSLLALGDETVAAAENALKSLRPGSRLASVARASLIAGTALRDGADAGLALTATLPHDPESVALSALPQLTQRGLLNGLTGDLDGAIADLSTVARRHATSLTGMLGISSHVHLVWCHYLLGDWAAAERALEVARDIATHHARDYDIGLLHSLSAILYAGRGEHQRAVNEVETARRVTSRADFSGPPTHMAMARAAIHQAEADWPAVVRELSALERHAEAQSDRARLYAVWWRPVLIEAQIRTGQYDQAHDVLSRLAAAPTLRSPAVGSSALDPPMPASWIATARTWLAGRLAEATGDLARARRSYQQGIEISPAGGGEQWYRALLQESYGSFLARRSEHREGLAMLNAAMRAFDRMGAQPFRDRAAALVGARIEDVREPWSGPLTSRERDVAECVARGWTNREIASELYVSEKTVEYHLGHIFAKLNIQSRRKLRDVIHRSESILGGVASA